MDVWTMKLFLIHLIRRKIIRYNQLFSLIG